MFDSNGLLNLSTNIHNDNIIRINNSPLGEQIDDIFLNKGDNTHE